MIFILLLIATTTFIAGAAAFFSVYGLAATFSGTFWSVVLMGASLEMGKLVAASYLYRYWTKTNIWLKSYLMAGVATLMLLTSTGIFGYLSSGYQTDVLPLKQVEQQVKVLEDEKVRLIQRKTQIDDQIASLPTNSVRGRTTLIKGFKDEQASVTARITELDKTILQNKTKLIETQAHIGPITYIASAFGLDTDNATKYLIYLIIFAFDPMAVSLTLAVNIALRLRKEELEEQAAAEKARKRAELDEELELERKRARDLADAMKEGMAAAVAVEVSEHAFDHHGLPEIPDDRIPPMPPVVEPAPEPVLELEPLPPSALPVETAIPFDQFELHEQEAPTFDPIPEPEPVAEVVDSPELHEPEPTPIDDAGAVMVAEEVEPLERPGDYVQEEDKEPPFREEPEVAEEPVAPVEEPIEPVRRRTRPYGAINASLSDAKLNELVQHYRWLKDKQMSGDALTQDDRWELSAIEEILRKNGLGLYIG